jgi:PAS domain S-box-containing protein
MIDLSGYSLEKLYEDGDFMLARATQQGRASVLLLSTTSEHPRPSSLELIKHIHSFRDDLDSAWATRPIDLADRNGIPELVLEDPGGDLLEDVIGHPLGTGEFLCVAISLAKAVGCLHSRGLIHRDIKPANIFVNTSTGRAWLTGFALTSRLSRQRQSPTPPEIIAGTLAYMAPEQTGRMNRSVDSRSDLYSLGVTLYEMFVGALPFAASDPMEWVHCHIARLPVAPHRRRVEIPAQLSAIILKLLAKAPEDRYQTAAGLEADLQRCLSALEECGRIDSFPLGARDVPKRVLIPEKLYGREREVETLLAAFDRVVAQSSAELVLVSGYSGVGKSSVVHELHKALVPPRGLFASGKFDQFKRDIPYATLAQAFQTLVRQILGRDESEITHWRNAFSEALGQNGQLIVNLIPEIELIIGSQPPVAELPPQEAQARFQLLFRRFLGVFARPEHPLALFLDDLQWLDAATLKLLEYLVTEPDVCHVIFIGAYRDNEVGPAHPLSRTLEALRTSGAKIQDIVLQPLTQADVTRLISDSLRCEPKQVDSLSALVFEKTDGNPFFTIQFMTELEEEGLLTLEPGSATWKWDVDRIRAKGYSDNVVDLMVGKLNRFPAATQESLKQLTCLGNSAEFETLQAVYQDSKEKMHAQLWEAVRAGLIFRSDNAYRFLHDRVQEAAYSLIPQEQRAQSHLRIGRILAESTPHNRLEESIFDIVNQLNRGAELITAAKEREQAARLNLIAGTRAKASTAYASALKYLHAGRILLGEEAWGLNYDLTFSIESLTAECELLTAEMVSAENRLTLLSQRATSRHDFAVVTRLQVTLYTTLDRSGRAIEVFLDYLRRNGTDWSQHPTRDDVTHEYNRIWALLGDRQIEDLVALPLLRDPDILDMLDVFTEIVHPAMFFDENLSTLVVYRMVTLSLEHGICDAACFGFVWFGMFAGPRFNNYKDGFRFGQLGYDLVEKRGLTRYQARTYISFGTLTPWAKHVKEGRDLVRRTFEVAYRTADLTFSAYSWHELITNYLAAGDPLPEVQSEAEKGLAFVKKAGFGLVAENCGAQLGLIRTLRGLTPKFGHLDYPDYSEPETEHRLASNPTLALAEFFYWTRKLQARFFAGDYAEAVEASRKAHALLWPAASQLETGDFRFFAALAHAAAWNSVSAEERPQYFAALTDHHQQLEMWAQHCPANFEHRTALVSAELARIEGRPIDAEHLYETAIRSAHENGFIHNEAVANECAARFYSTRGLAKIAHVYLRDARNCYLRWGADGKVRQLDEHHPHVKEAKSSAQSSTMGTSFEHLDLATVIKVSQAVSSQHDLEKLIDILMRTAIEHAGAQRGLLILPDAGRLRIEAEATTTSDTISVQLRETGSTSIEWPDSIAHYVARTHENVILENAAAQSAFSQDAYIKQHQVRSVLCLPLLKQAKLIGVLYLENNLAQGIFTPGRVSVLKMLASEAAISLENARLYGELREGEARIRRLVEANIIGIMIWRPDGLVVDANEAFLHLVNYTRDDFVSGRVRWTDLTPAEWRERDEEALEEIKATGAFRPFEKEYLRKNGSRVPVLIGGAIFETNGSEGVAFILDLSEQKRAESAMRRAQSELAHVSRITTLGELTASIAHEVNQPLGSVVNNANACLTILSGSSPHLDEVREALAEIIEGAERASAVVSRVRSLSKKMPYDHALVDLNDVVTEVISMVQHEAVIRGVSIRANMDDDLPAVRGDRVQLQQVLLNLVVNGMDAMAATEASKRAVVISGQRELRDEKSWCLLGVQDAGTGIKAGEADHLFEAFYTTKSEGMGMGLAISRSIIEAHGGELWADTKQGLGATFRFRLPAGRDAKS